jgi:hypothetical protein
VDADIGRGLGCLLYGLAGAGAFFMVAAVVLGSLIVAGVL